MSANSQRLSIPSARQRAMLHGCEQWGVLDQQAELGSHYKAFVPAADQFRISKPFSAQAGPPAVQQGQERKKRKRSKSDIESQHEQQPSGQEQGLDCARPASQRHPELIGSLSRHYDAYQDFLHAAQSVKPQSTHSAASPALTAEADTTDSTDLVSACTASPKPGATYQLSVQQSQPPSCSSDPLVLDLPALAAFKAIVEPQFSWLPMVQPHIPQPANCDLFDQLIRNDDEHEALGLAHEARVVLPARTAFMLGDIKDISRLVQGACSALACCSASAIWVFWVVHGMPRPPKWKIRS